MEKERYQSLQNCWNILSLHGKRKVPIVAKWLKTGCTEIQGWQQLGLIPSCGAALESSLCQLAGTHYHQRCSAMCCRGCGSTTGGASWLSDVALLEEKDASSVRVGFRTFFIHIALVMKVMIGFSFRGKDFPTFSGCPQKWCYHGSKCCVLW